MQQMQQCAMYMHMYIVFDCVYGMNVHVHVLHRKYCYFIHVLWDSVGPFFAWFLAEELPAMVVEIGPPAQSGMPLP